MTNFRLKICCLNIAIQVTNLIMLLMMHQTMKDVLIISLSFAFNSWVLWNFYQPELKKIKKALFGDDDFSGGNFS